ETRATGTGSIKSIWEPPLNFYLQSIASPVEALASASRGQRGYLSTSRAPPSANWRELGSVPLSSSSALQPLSLLWRPVHNEDARARTPHAASWHGVVPASASMLWEGERFLSETAR
ncbi:hypothetical protein Dimus_016054, partial [Dionaea muscipula]